jgi:hypothetical protein
MMEMEQCGSSHIAPKPDTSDEVQDVHMHVRGQLSRESALRIYHSPHYDNIGLPSDNCTSSFCFVGHFYAST